MSDGILLAALAALVIVALLVALPVVLFLLHQRLRELERRLDGKPAAPPTAGGQPPAPVVARPTALPTPPALPESHAPRRPAGPDPLAAGLRRIGLLPPENLRGEGALGSWIAARVGGALALAAIVFLGIWLNLRSSLPAWFRLAEVVALGVAVLWGGARLGRTREDLGKVLVALGLGILQFAAWASHGLDRMQVIESPVFGGLVQLAAAAAIGLVALRVGSAQLGQLSAWFLILSGLLGARVEEGAFAQGLHMVALAGLGALTLWRRSWTTVAWVALGGATLIGLLLPADETAVAAAAALATLLLLWLATQSMTARGGWASERQRAGLTYAAVVLPAIVLIACAPWTESPPSALAALASAAICGLAGLRERRLGGQAGEMLLTTALVFAGASGAWAMERGLDWLPWVLAAAAAHLIARRGGSRLTEWISDLLAAAATFMAALDGTPVSVAEILLGIAALSLLLGFRGARLQAAGALRAALPVTLLSLLLIHRHAGGDLPSELGGLAWLLPLLAAFGTRNALPVLAALPVLLLASAATWGWLDGWSVPDWKNWNPPQAGWASLLLAVQLGATLWLSRRTGGFASRATAACAGLTLLPVCLHLAVRLIGTPSPHAGLMLGHSPLFGWGAWILAAGITWLTALALRRLGSGRGEALILVTALILAGYQPEAGPRAQPDQVLAWSALCLTYIWLALALVARESRTVGWSRSLAAVASAGLLLLLAGLTGHLHGYRSTVIWLLAGGLAFAVGHLGGSRPIRLAAVAFLGLATLKLVASDISDLVGRIIACAVAAAAFLGIAWAYGRLAKDGDGAKGGVD